MSTTSASLIIRGMRVEVLYKAIKNLHISVHPPDGAVRVAAPLRLDPEQVRLAVIQRLPWIKSHQRQLQDAVRQSPREMVTGESHYLWGMRLRLTVTERPGRPEITVAGQRLNLAVAPGSSTEQRIQALQSWQRSELRGRIQALISTWEPTIGRAVPFWSIRKMKTR